MCGEQSFHRRGDAIGLHSMTIASSFQSFPLRAFASSLRCRTNLEGTSMNFDPNVATARYIDSLGPAALQKAHDYTVGKEWMLLWGLIVAAAVTWLIVRSGVLDAVERRIAERRRILRA